MATSTIPTVKAALLAALQARPGLTDAAVTWGVPRGTPDRDWITLDDVTGEQRTAALGHQRRTEAYTLGVTVSVVRSAVDDPAQVATRCFTLVAEIEDELRANPRLGVDSVVHAWVAKTDLVERMDGEQREARALVDVYIETRI